MRLKTAAFTIFAVGFLLTGFFSMLPAKQVQAAGEKWTINCTSSLRVEDCTVVGEGGALHGKNTFVYKSNGNQFVGSVRYAADPNCYFRQDFIIEKTDIIHDTVKTGDPARLVLPSRDNGGTCTNAKIVQNVGAYRPGDDTSDEYIPVKLTAGAHAPENDGTICGADKECTDGEDEGVGESPELQCETSLLNPLTWLVCPIVTAAQSAVTTLDEAIDVMMNINTDKNSAFDTAGENGVGQAYHTAWSSFRSLGIGIIIIAGLLMIISQAAGMEIFDAYTIRKTLPRLLIAGIFITLSWYVVGFFIQLSNDVGNSVRAIIYQPFKSINTGGIALQSNGSLVAGLVGGIAIYSLGLLGLASFALSALVAVIVAFVILVARELIILVLIITAPLAIACYVLPNTQRAFNFWRDTLISMLLVFPIISAFIAVGRVFAIIAYTSGGEVTFNPNPSGIEHHFAVLAYNLGFAQTTNSPGLLQQGAAFVAYFLPYFLFKAAFSMAGGLYRTITSAVSGAGSGVQSGIAKRRAARQQKRAEKRAAKRAAWAAGNRFKGDTRVGNWLNAAGRNVTNVRNAGIRPSKMAARMRAANIGHEGTEVAEFMDKNTAFAAIKGNDDYLQATMKNMGGGENEADWRRYLEGVGYRGRALEDGIALIRAAKRSTSNEVFQRAAVMANPTTGTGWKKGGAAQMMESIIQAAGGDRTVAMNMLAQMRSAASQAGRLDLSGSGFGTQGKQLDAMLDEYDKTGKISDETKTNVKHAISKNMIETKGAGEWARMRGQAVENLVPELRYDLEQAHARVAKSVEGTAERRNAERALAQKYAHIENIHDSLNHASPENAKLIADGVLQQPVGGMPVMERIKGYKNGTLAESDAYAQTRKDYDALRNATGTDRLPDAG